jgi:hypothetical protein
MENVSIGDLVSVAGAGDVGPTIDGLVFDTPSRTKVVVAVVDKARGPVFRTVHPDSLTEREAEGPDDPALRSLARRTPPPNHGGGRAGSAGRKGSAGFTRGPAHRPTGR